MASIASYVFGGTLCETKIRKSFWKLFKGINGIKFSKNKAKGNKAIKKLKAIALARCVTSPEIIPERYNLIISYNELPCKFGNLTLCNKVINCLITGMFFIVSLLIFIDGDTDFTDASQRTLTLILLIS